MSEHPDRTTMADGVEMPERSWLYDHIGRLAGFTLGIIAFACIAFLAAIGSKSALGLLIVVVFGVFTISVGTRLRGGRR